MNQTRQTRWNKAESGFRRVVDVIRRIVQDESGVTAIEYALLASLIVIAASGAISVLGGGVDGLWTHIQGKVAEALK